MKIKVDYEIKRNFSSEKPCEDFLLIDEDKEIFIVSDGVTRDELNGKYPNPSPASEVSKLFTEQCLLEIANNLGKKKHDDQKLLLKSFKISNKEILKYNENYKDFLPGTVALALIIRNHTVSYCYIGDCIGIHLYDGIFTKFTRSQTKLIAQN